MTNEIHIERTTIRQKMFAAKIMLFVIITFSIAGYLLERDSLNLIVNEVNQNGGIDYFIKTTYPFFLVSFFSSLIMLLCISKIVLDAKLCCKSLLILSLASLFVAPITFGLLAISFYPWVELIGCILILLTFYLMVQKELHSIWKQRKELLNSLSKITTK